MKLNNKVWGIVLDYCILTMLLITVVYKILFCGGSLINSLFLILMLLATFTTLIINFCKIENK